jgi:hypothetical protein
VVAVLIEITTHLVDRALEEISQILLKTKVVAAGELVH